MVLQIMSEKSCTVCSDFKAVRKSYQNKELKKQQTNEAENLLPCPPDRGQLGRGTWTFIHTMAAYYPSNPTDSEQNSMAGLIDGISKFYPCSDCAEHFQLEIKKSPPKLKSNIELSDWFCQIHNEVNERQGKALFDCSKVLERWRYGMKCIERE